LDSFTAFTSSNEAESKAIFIKREVDYVLTCVKSVEEKFFLGFEGDTLMRKITSNTPPKWLVSVKLPAKLEEKFYLYQFKDDTVYSQSAQKGPPP